LLLVESGVRPGRPVLARQAAELHRVGIVVANYNTRRLIAQLVFSLYRVLGGSEFAQLVVVDNASTDSSRDLLRGLQHAGLLHLIGNRTQRYHGPALTQGVSWLAHRQNRVAADEQLDYVWVLDSDVIILPSDAVRAALEMFKRPGAAAVGQTMGDMATTACSVVTRRCSIPAR
jgi:GT2 family glycosyltransferase